MAKKNAPLVINHKYMLFVERPIICATEAEYLKAFADSKLATAEVNFKGRHFVTLTKKEV